MNIYETVYSINSKHPNKEAMSIRMNDGTARTYTYGEMLKKADLYADRLLKAGLKAGDRIAFASEGNPEWTIAFLATAKVSCTSVLIDASLTAEEIDEFVRSSDVRGAFFSKKVYGKFGKIPKDYLFPVFNIVTGEVFPDALQAVSKETENTVDPDEEVACIIYSSGTTRHAAGIMHCHDRLLNTTQMTIDVQHLGGDSRFLAIIPNSHIYGVICLVLGPLLVGGFVHYIESISADAVLAGFQECKPTVLPAVPKVYELFMTQIMRKIKANPITKAMFKTFFPICLEKRRKNGSLLGKKIFKSIHEAFGGQLQFVCSAGAPLNKDVAEFYYGTGFNILLTYGASETNIPTIGNRPEDIHTDSCGVPYPAVDVKFTDAGEILIRSPYMMKGYFRDAEATKAAFTEDGWFKTGDLGHQDENGYIHITGRLKENIVLSSGKKITPDDLERKYGEIEGVKEFVICGVPNAETNYDEVHAFIVPENDSKESLERIKTQLKELGTKLVQNMRVSKAHFVAEIPRTSLQKPKRYLLKQLALSHADAKELPFQEKKTTSDDMTTRVMEVVAKIANTDVQNVSPQTKIFEELSIDSLSSINLALELEDIYKKNIESFYFDEMTIADIVLALQDKATKKQVIGQEHVKYPQDKTNFDYALYAFFRGAAKHCYKMQFHDVEKVPMDKGFILCANHVSKIDILFLSSAFPKERILKFCCMAKKELFRNDPFSRQLIKSAGMVPVDRSGINMETMNNICARLKENWCVAIHPEGTRSEDGIFREMKSGAAVLSIDANVPIVPVYVEGAFEIFPKGRKMMRFFDWKHMKKFPLDITYGDPIYPEQKDVETLKNEVQDAILKLQETCHDFSKNN